MFNPPFVHLEGRRSMSSAISLLLVTRVMLLDFLHQNLCSITLTLTLTNSLPLVFSQVVAANRNVFLLQTDMTPRKCSFLCHSKEPRDPWVFARFLLAVICQRCRVCKEHWIYRLSFRIHPPMHNHLSLEEDRQPARRKKKNEELGIRTMHKYDEQPC